jgi:hypothetical protein
MRNVKDFSDPFVLAKENLFVAYREGMINIFQYFAALRTLPLSCAFLALFLLTSCAGLLPATYQGPALELRPPAGITEVENQQNILLCRELAAGSIPIATHCMQRRGYKLVEATASN